tara:strand:+ start:400 stop:657 length:258 start_codon:yes stop_codon:yes gene_type:complete
MNDLETYKKKIIFKASHRGSKEMDIMLGNFIKKYIELFNENELGLFNDILECDDDDIYQWIIGKKEIPSQYSNRVFSLLINNTKN